MDFFNSTWDCPKIPSAGVAGEKSKAKAGNTDIWIDSNATGIVTNLPVFKGDFELVGVVDLDPFVDWVNFGVTTLRTAVNVIIYFVDDEFG